jgi:hypothetical protein
MNSIDHAILAAEEKAAYKTPVINWRTSAIPWAYKFQILLDPDFWECLGQARHWGSAGYYHREKGDFYPAWQYNWHRFIDHLAEGKDAESFFASL